MRVPADEMSPKARRRNEEERVARPRLLVADVLRHADRVGEAGSSGLVRGAQATCAICQEDFDDQSPDGFTKCGHRFHRFCPASLAQAEQVEVPDLQGLAEGVSLSRE